MTRKHFQLLADTFKFSRPVRSRYLRMDGTDATLMLAADNQWLQDVRAIADACKSDNVRFDRDRFLAACGASE